MTDYEFISEINDLPVATYKVNDFELETELDHKTELHNKSLKEALESKFSDDNYDVLFYRHWMQFLCVKNQDTSNPLVYEYAEGFMYMAKHGNANDGTLDYYSLIIEIDAFAFQKYFLKEVLEIETHYPDPGYDKILDKFIKKFY